MKIKNIALLYMAFLMLLSQTEWDKVAIFFALPALIALIFRHKKMSFYGFRKIFFLNLIVIIGFVSGLMHLADYDLYYFFRDIIYFIQPTIFIVIGFYLYKEINSFKCFLQIIVITSTCISLYNMSYILTNPEIFFQLGIGSRYEYNLSNSSALLSFVILNYTKKNRYHLFKKYIKLTFIYIAIFSIIISFSRTFYTLLLITLIIPYISRNRMVFIMYGASILLVLFIIFGGLLTEMKGGGNQGTTFKSKVMHSLDEMIVRSYNSHTEINQNWRGYEAYLGLSKYYEGGVYELIFGQGYGAVVITPFWVFHGEKLNVLPIFHNGYITIILKSGLVGLFSFFLFLYTLLKVSFKVIKEKNHQRQLAGMLLQSSVFIIFFQTFVVHGIFKTTVPVLLLVMIGGLLQIISTQLVNLNCPKGTAR